MRQAEARACALYPDKANSKTILYSLWVQKSMFTLWDRGMQKRIELSTDTFCHGSHTTLEMLLWSLELLLFAGFIRLVSSMTRRGAAGSALMGTIGGAASRSRTLSTPEACLLTTMVNSFLLGSLQGNHFYFWIEHMSTASLPLNMHTWEIKHKV